MVPPLVAVLGSDAGRIEGWVDGRPCTAEDCRDPQVYRQVAASLAKLHGAFPRDISIADSKKGEKDEGDEEDGAGGSHDDDEGAPLEGTWAYETCCRWLRSAEESLRSPESLVIDQAWLTKKVEEEDEKEEELEAEAVEAMLRARAGRLLASLPRARSNLAKARSAIEEESAVPEAEGGEGVGIEGGAEAGLGSQQLRRRGMPRCFCHNDVSPSNVHLNDATGTAQLIDFEFGGVSR